MVQSESGELENVDEAVLKSLSERCTGCGLYGASISCRVEECPKKFHYPCASAFGGFQDVKMLAMFCSVHLDQVLIGNMDAPYAKCEQVKHIQELLFCTSCGQHYHSCRCLDCTVCEGCGRGDDEQHLLLCDERDMSTHTYCLDPPLDSILPGARRCAPCLICEDMFMAAAGGSAHVMDVGGKVCGSYWNLSCCSLCRSNYREMDLNFKCEKCKRWAHGKCNRLPNEEAVEKTMSDGPFVYLLCRPKFGMEVSRKSMEGIEKIVDASQNVDGMDLTKSGVAWFGGARNS